jgi:hypothetical protein
MTLRGLSENQKEKWFSSLLFGFVPRSCSLFSPTWSFPHGRSLVVQFSVFWSLTTKRSFQTKRIINESRRRGGCTQCPRENIQDDLACRMSINTPAR